MYNEPLITNLSMFMVVTSIAAVESRNLRVSVQAYAVQALMIVGLLLAYSAENPALVWWAVTAFFTKAVLTPLFLFGAIEKTGRDENPPIIGFGFSIVISAVLAALIYGLVVGHVRFLAPTHVAEAHMFRVNLAIALTVFAIGLYGILTRRDAIKTVIGLCLLENGVHISLVSLAPTMRETALAGIATEVVVTVLMLLYIIRGIYEKFGSRDTFQLSELHW